MAQMCSGNDEMDPKRTDLVPDAGRIIFLVFFHEATPTMQENQAFRWILLLDRLFYASPTSFCSVHVRTLVLLIGIAQCPSLEDFDWLLSTISTMKQLSKNASVGSAVLRIGHSDPPHLSRSCNYSSVDRLLHDIVKKKRHSAGFCQQRHQWRCISNGWLAVKK
jgi:hypothetical protein